MLRELSVQNLALIEDARVELERGYCVWTGETGAGKSLLLTALSLVLGGKASASLVRDGKTEACAAAVFDIEEPILRRDLEEVLGGTLEGDDLILTRRVSRTGKSLAAVNDVPVTVATLRRLGTRLIDIHGQDEGRALLEPESQRGSLDDYGNLKPLVEEYRNRRAAYMSLLQRRSTLQMAAQSREREQDLLCFERDELTAAEPRRGEYDELSQEVTRLANGEALRRATAEGYQSLYEADRSAQEILETVARKLAPLATSVPALSRASSELDRLADEVREIAYELRQIGRDLRDDPGRLDEVENRLALYRRLASRFRCSPDELEARLELVKSQLAAIDRDEEDLRHLDGPIAFAWSDLKTAAMQLSAARIKAARGLTRSVQAHLKGLCLQNARISILVEASSLSDHPGPPPPESGVDQVEILFAPNLGECPQPLRKIASGGELSRVTLAVKSVLATADRVPTMVFDEIDTGVGGRLGAALGKALAALSTTRQVLCVTHLPQMASFASHQWVIRKSSAKGRTRTTITRLDEPERVRELALMIRGDSASHTTNAEALAMLAEARVAN